MKIRPLKTTNLLPSPGLPADTPPPTTEESPWNLADLTFLTCKERTELGEIWEVRTPDGQSHRCQFLPVYNPPIIDALLGRLRDFHHPSLVPWMALRSPCGRLALLSHLEGPTLAEKFQELQATDQPYMLREDLLGYLRSAAVALDYLQARRRIQHLWLNPGQFVLHGDEVKILGFGLAATWWARTQKSGGELNPRYSAPELHRKSRGPRCDQYSLALIFAEMVTGQHPFHGRGSDKAGRRPDLSLLPQSDREIIQRALSHDYRQRFDCATEMVEALENANKVVLSPVLFRVLAPSSGVATIWSSLDHFVEELVSIVADKANNPEQLNIHFRLEQSKALEAPPLLEKAKLKLPAIDDFCRQWHAKTIRRQDGLVILAINAAPSLWQWLSGRRQGLQVRLRFHLWLPGKNKKGVSVTIQPFGCSREQAARLLKELGPKLLQSVRSFFKGQPDDRHRDRLAIRQRLHVYPIIQGDAAAPIECVTKDVSLGGIGFFLPGDLPASQVYIRWPELENIANFAALAQIVRKQPARSGWVEVGAAFPLAPQ